MKHYRPIILPGPSLGIFVKSQIQIPNMKEKNKANRIKLIAQTNGIQCSLICFRSRMRLLMLASILVIPRPRTRPIGTDISSNSVISLQLLILQPSCLRVCVGYRQSLNTKLLLYSILKHHFKKFSFLV